VLWCIVLLYVAGCCSMLHCATTCCSAYAVCVITCATCCSVLQRIAVCCNVLQHVAVCCSSQRVVACCSVLHCDATHIATCMCVQHILQHACACNTYCNMLQLDFNVSRVLFFDLPYFDASHCNTLCCSVCCSVCCSLCCSVSSLIL